MVNPVALGQMVASTWNRVEKQVSEQISQLNILVECAKKKWKKTYDGGKYIDERLSYAENDSYQRYQGYDILTRRPQDIFTIAQFVPKMAKISLVFSAQELLDNSGRAKLIDLVKQSVTNMKMTMDNELEADLWSDGTADGGKQIGGIQLLIADDPTSGTVGSIDRSLASAAFWRNLVQTDSGTALTKSTIEQAMNSLYIALAKNKRKPTKIIADSNYYQLFEESQLSFKQIVNTQSAKGGYTELMYKGVPLVMAGSDSPTDRMYFIHEPDIKFRVHKDRDFVNLGSQPKGKDGMRDLMVQDGYFTDKGFYGNLTINRGRSHGVLRPQ